MQDIEEDLSITVNAERIAISVTGSVTFCLVQVRLVPFRLGQVRLDIILPRQHFA